MWLVFPPTGTMLAITSTIPREISLGPLDREFDWRLRITASCEAMHQHCTALVPILRAMPLQLHAASLNAEQQLADRPLDLRARRPGARALGAQHGLRQEGEDGGRGRARADGGGEGPTAPRHAAVPASTMAQPAAKKARTAGEVEPAPTEEAKVAEPAKPAEPAKAVGPPPEAETDAPACTKPKVQGSVRFLTRDTTLNLLPSACGGIFMAMGDGGIKSLFAGARASVGLTSGRYMFEAKILECCAGSDARGKGAHVLRVGFSAAGSALVVGADKDGVCFESDGDSDARGCGFIHNQTRVKAGVSFARGDIVAALLNLDKASSNFNTVSLFKNGLRISQPQQIPDNLKGKALFPHISFKGVSVHTNFGPTPLAPLPFTCRMVQDAAKTDTAVAVAQEPADGKYEVVVPVGLPDEGTFDWLDLWLEKNAGYTELSDRMLVAWAEQSGMGKPRGAGSKVSGDKPAAEWHDFDIASVRRAVYSIAPLQSRHYVVMEVRGNLIKDERQALVKRFSDGAFKIHAHVAVGTPTQDFKDLVQRLTLKQKQESSDRAFQLKKMEEKRKWQLAKAQFHAAKAKKKAEKERQQKLKEMQKKVAAAKAAAAKAKEGEAKEGEGKEEKKPEEEKEEEKEVEEPEEVEEFGEPEPADEVPPKVALTAEEKAMVYRPRDIKDLTPLAFSSSFTKFSLPAADEGFAAVKYEWSKGPKCDEYLRQWILERKFKNRVEELVPSVWFKTKLQAWRSAVSKYQGKQTEYRASVAKKAADKLAKEAKARAAALAAEKKKAEKKDGAEDKGEEVKKAEEAAEEEEEEEADFAGLDVFGAEDVLDIGGGMPLFRDFSPEDWAMLGLRFELHLLAHAFRHDVDDPERLGVHTDHLDFYFQRYFGRALLAKDYGKETVEELVGLVDDVVYVNAKGVLESQVEAELETPSVFVKATEEARRRRALRLDLGEEAAKLRLAPAALQGQGSRHSKGNRQDGNKWWSSYGKVPSDRANYSHQPYGNGKGGKTGGKGGAWW
eukprot:CAMPEP_0198608606 /NCGR_PEP_ID=MMETSP1462-20131121/155978_1 /TAXON_ID=1333877 /ORGANISM="Brandtodinium nutriculum, Strain RCC3387" /LENGTH=1011 /DNA_ID=CAMNT_0044340411 /DNA_START=236 /DNA_END=3272 /DNA_ORIENTATION=-